MPWMQWRACMWLKLSLFGLVLCPDWLREDAGVGDRSKEVVEVCSHHRWETSLGLSYVCAHGWAETLLVIHLLGRLSPEEIWSAEDSDLKMWGADRDMIRSFHSCNGELGGLVAVPASATADHCWDPRSHSLWAPCNSQRGKGSVPLGCGDSQWHGVGDCCLLYTSPSPRD